MRKGNMGQGRGERRRGGRGKNKRMMGFLQPCILMQLTKGDRHGYDLLMGLDDFIDDARQYDPSIIYRLLRDLEANGHVASYEGDISLGPKRKMYSITAAGKNLLHTWMEDLRSSRKEIDRLLDVYAEHYK
ncbi:MAG: PadR family transcriptional regulator [Desulfopila sp.]